VKAEMLDLCASYNIAIREIMYNVRQNVKTECTGCVRSGAGDVYICGSSDVKFIENLMNVYLRKKKVSNFCNKAAEKIYQTLPSVFNFLAGKLKDEMSSEELFLKSFSGGVPIYIRQCERSQRKLVNVSFDV
jgi:hypothetical protein